MIKQEKTRFPRGEYRKNWDMVHRDPNKEYIRGKQKQEAVKFIEDELLDLDEETEEEKQARRDYEEYLEEMEEEEKNNKD
jgi:hypothetical protein